MAELKEYKCPNCRGDLIFDSSLQKMKCPYCDSTFSVEELVSLDEDLNEEQVHDTANDEDGLRVYVCNSCGGTVVGEETTAASFCPYCGNPVTMTGNLSGQLKPDLIIPFQLDKKAAKEAYYAHIKGKRLLPRVFREENHIDEIKGLYVPFWLFDAQTEGQAQFDARTVRSWRSGNYRYTETKYYRADRGGSVHLQDIPVDGSEKLPNDLTESLEPFGFAQAKPFQTAYLAGYLADKYDMDAEQCQTFAESRCINTLNSLLRKTVTGYDSVSLSDGEATAALENKRYALCPVWLLNTTWKDRKFTFAMNGQTGKLVGDLPTDIGRFFAWLSGITLGGTALLMLVYYLYFLFG